MYHCVREDSDQISVKRLGGLTEFHFLSGKQQKASVLCIQRSETSRGEVEDRMETFGPRLVYSTQEVPNWNDVGTGGSIVLRGHSQLENGTEIFFFFHPRNKRLKERGAPFALRDRVRQPNSALWVAEPSDSNIDLSSSLSSGFFSHLHSSYTPPPALRNNPVAARGGSQ